MNDVNQDQEAISGAQPVDVNAGELSQLQQLIIRPEALLRKLNLGFQSFVQLKKKTSDRLISMVKRRDFVIEDIRAETIRELETLIFYCSRSKI
jgi:hypothetical protein